MGYLARTMKLRVDLHEMPTTESSQKTFHGKYVYPADVMPWLHELKATSLETKETYLSSPEYGTGPRLSWKINPLS